jgi:hypothetical protein
MREYRQRLKSSILKRALDARAAAGLLPPSGGAGGGDGGLYAGLLLSTRAVEDKKVIIYIHEPALLPANQPVGCLGRKRVCRYHINDCGPLSERAIFPFRNSDNPPVYPLSTGGARETGGAERGGASGDGGGKVRKGVPCRPTPPSPLARARA